MTPLLRALSVIWFGGFAFFLSFYLLLGAFPLYLRGIGVSSELVGVVVGCFALASMITRPWAGWAADRFGRRPLLIAGSIIFVLAVLGYTWSVLVVPLLLFRLLHGSGMGLYPTAASALVADVAPPERRGQLLGMFDAAGNLAQALGPIAGIVIAQRFGFQALFGAAASAGAAAVALSLAVSETLIEPKRDRFGIARAFSRPALFPSVLVLCMMLTYGVQAAMLPIYADAHGANPGLFFLIFASVVALIRSPAGWLSDRLGRPPVSSSGLAVITIALAVLAFAGSPVAVAVAAMLYGLGIGIAQPAVVAWCVDVADRAERGRAIGTYYVALELGIALGAAASGVLVSALGFAVTFLVAGAASLAGAVLALAPMAAARQS